MSEVTAKSFLNILNQSGIVASDQLRPSLAELKSKSGGKPIKLNQLTQHLIDAGLITQWHCQKLLNGRYKGFFLGKYKLLQHLGTGGMSTVYLAQHTIFSQQRAIKVLPKKRIDDKTYLDRFYREGRAAASLNHKNIVRVYDIANEGNTHYLVMEYVEGTDIYNMVKQSGPLAFPVVVDYMIQALSGLQHAHENHLVHRDIKPANLLVTPDGVVKILDLGLALFREEAASLTVMHNEKVLGTADYLSPEQAVDSHNIDQRADIYSLGCTVYYMLTGHPPFGEGTIAQRIAMHQSCQPTSVSEYRRDCPESLKQVCAKMMAKNPDDRFQSCNELKTRMLRISEELSTAITQTSITPATASPPAATPAAAKPKPVSPATRRPTGTSRPTPKTPTPTTLTPTTPIPTTSTPTTSTPTTSTPATPAKQAARKSPTSPSPTRRTRAQPRGRKDSNKSPGATTDAARQPVRRAAKFADPQSRSSGGGAISLVTGDEPKPQIEIDPDGLRDFGRRHAPVTRSVLKHRSTVTRTHLIVAALVLAMVLSLAGVLALAMKLTNRSDEKKASNLLRQPILVNQTVQIKHSMYAPSDAADSTRI